MARSRTGAVRLAPVFQPRGLLWATQCWAPLCPWARGLPGAVSPTGGTASPQHGSRGEMAPQQPEQRQAAEAAKFLINIIKARILLPMDVLPASIHQGNELCEELLPL